MAKSWMGGDIPNTHIKDYQAKQIFQAEDSCMFWGDTDILTWEQVQNIIQRISEWAEISPPTLLEEGHLIAYATADTISLPFPISKTLPYICHEMSHVINYNGTNADHHGKHFAGGYLEVVEEFIGTEASQDLKRAFKVYGVEHKR